MTINNTTIEMVQGDITKVTDVDAIVNAANRSLLGGGGVDGAIHRAAGPDLLKECRTLGGCETGEAKITKAYNLPCKYVIHTVGPIYHQAGEEAPQLLANCYWNSLALAASHGIRSIAFPSISTGVYAYPLNEAAKIAYKTVDEFVSSHPYAFDKVEWVLFDDKTKAAYDQALYNGMVEVMASADTWSTDPMVLGFYRETEDHGCFSNWYPAEFDYAGVHYKNSEQFMMVQKVCQFGQYNLGEHMMRDDDLQICKRLAGDTNALADEAKLKAWRRTRHAIVKRGVKAKFAQNPELLQELLDTGTALLAECSPSDGVWGIHIGLDDPDHQDVSKWNGDNLLGVILMEIRVELRQELRESSNGTLVYEDYHDAKPIDEWKRTAGELKRIPQYYSAIHAYADTLKNPRQKDVFYNSCSLYDWEIAMNTNMGGGLPWAGFFEMKQEVYEIAKRLRLHSGYEMKR